MSRNLYLLACLPALLLAGGGVAVYLTEDDDPVRLAATIGGGVAITVVLVALLWGAARAQARGPRTRPGASRPGSPIAWLVIAGLGALALAAGVVLGAREYAFDQHAEAADARVVDSETVGIGQNASRRGVVRFETGEGETIDAKLSPLPTTTDGTLRIRYDRRDPESVRPAARRTQWVGPGLLLAGGGVVLVASLVASLRRGLLTRGAGR